MFDMPVRNIKKPTESVVGKHPKAKNKDKEPAAKKPGKRGAEGDGEDAKSGPRKKSKKSKKDKSK